MILGTMRPEEARVHDSHKGFHQFHADEPDITARLTFGSFEIFWDDADVSEHGGQARNYDGDGEPVKPGWYWWACFPGCLPDGDAVGPFATSRQALQDADPYNPEFDE